MPRSREPHLHGLLVVDKPPFLTSHDVVARIRRLTGIRRVGHAGTLDPFATGVVVVAVGRATRVLQYVENTDKRYVAHVVLGAETDSGDVDGVVIARETPDSWPTEEQIHNVVQNFIGEVEQVPPVYSAIKVGGQPLHRQVRAGKDVEAPVRLVTIYAIEVLTYNPPDLVLAIHCGKGTYIRALARDIGAQLATHGYCHALRRTATGRFCLEQAWPLDELMEMEAIDHWRDIALHPDFALADLPALLMSGEQRTAWYHGQSFAAGSLRVDHQQPFRAYGPAGGFAGIGQTTDSGTVKPAFVFSVDESDPA